MMTVQDRDRRIGALRQVVSLLRGNRADASDGARAGWADELEKLADEEASDAREDERRASHRHIVAYLRSELGLDRAAVMKIAEDVVAKVVRSVSEYTIKERAAAAARSPELDPARMAAKIVSTVAGDLTKEVRAIVTSEARQMVEGRLDVVLRPPGAVGAIGGG